jgi:hypothetical protein
VELRKGWLDDVVDDLKQVGVRGWRNIARDRDTWRYREGLLFPETRKDKL